jgi:hypothetical protein
VSGLEAFEEEAAPDFKSRQRVKVHAGECSGGLPLCTTGGRVAAPPYRGVDGRWYVHVLTFGGVAAYPCFDVEPMRR